MKIFRPSLIIFVCFVLLYLVSSCSRETVVPVDPELPADTITTPPVDTCADCGWERLEGIPLLGYGEPVDRREEARAHIEAVRAKLRLLGWMHDYNFIPNMYAVQEIALLYPDTRRLYAHARRMGATKDVSFQDFRYENLIPDAYSYLSDTVVIYIGGGPDYSTGTDHAMCLWQSVYKATVPGYTTNYDSSAYIPTTRWLMDRPFNLPHTSIIEVPHSTAGLFAYPGSTWNCTIQFFDFDGACGNFQAEWPYNILSYEDAGLVNDIGVELLRYTVELLKQKGKTIAFYGSSWGAFVMARYLLYYPITDFERVVLNAFNPNNCKEQMEIDREDINKFLETGRSRLGQELYEMCRWRMLPWLTKHDLSRLRMIVGREDTNVGFPTEEELSALTAAGATVVELPGVGHGIAGPGNQRPLSPADTAVRYLWEDNMIIHTKSGTQVIKNSRPRNTAPPQLQPAVPATTESNHWRIYKRNDE